MIEKAILIYFVTINIIAFVIYGVDKAKAKTGAWRTPELTLILMSAFGGGIGSLLGMKMWHHKTKKLKFQLLVTLFTAAWIVLMVYIFRFIAK